ncbi:unnamed protein product [Linum tenue]|uniref:Bromo domain-containing protein n=1 Tax=Linum tenue TaxID=586396 RepID=A0AAV0LDL9_9ROSI|nr:unnamed protein product [Linum tenue]
MDFGTMRAKLQEEMYTSLEQFERDVFLVFNNAMRFNMSNSAEDLSILGRQLFPSLRTEPRNFNYIYPRTMQQMSNEAQGEAGGPRAKLVKSGGATDVHAPVLCSANLPVAVHPNPSRRRWPAASHLN